jgi:hypothetical protein
VKKKYAENVMLDCLLKLPIAEKENAVTPTNSESKKSPKIDLI